MPAGYWKCDCGRECREPGKLPDCRAEWVPATLTSRRIVGHPTMLDLEWLCAHPKHSMIMTEIDEVFVPMIVDENGRGPVVPRYDE